MAANVVESKVASAPPSIVALSEEEREKKYAALRQRLSKPPSSVTGPAGWTPYWARVNDDYEMHRLDVLGFKVVHDDPKARRYQANGFREDGTYRYGDVILMEIPTDEYEFFCRENEARAVAMVEGVGAQLKGEAEKSGVPVFDVKPKAKAR